MTGMRCGDTLGPWPRVSRISPGKANRRPADEYQKNDILVRPGRGRTVPAPRCTPAYTPYTVPTCRTPTDHCRTLRTPTPWTTDSRAPLRTPWTTDVEQPCTTPYTVGRPTAYTVCTLLGVVGWSPVGLTWPLWPRASASAKAKPSQGPSATASERAGSVGPWSEVGCPSVGHRRLSLRGSPLVTPCVTVGCHSVGHSVGQTGPTRWVRWLVDL